MSIKLGGLILFLVGVSNLDAQTRSSDGINIPILTVSTLPSASADSGKSFYISDSTTGCSIGGGSALALCRSNGSSWVAITSGGGSGAIHYISFSATPTWSAVSGISDLFCFHTTTLCDTLLSANVTSITFSGGTAGEYVGASFIQASSGGPYTVALPTGFDACPVSSVASARTQMSWWWDGSVAHLISCNTTGPGEISLSAAPGTPPSGQVFSWCDSTSKICRSINDAGTIFQGSKELTVGNLRVTGGPNAADTGIATDTNTAHALCGGSPPAFGTSCTGGSGGNTTETFDLPVGGCTTAGVATPLWWSSGTAPATIACSGTGVADAQFASATSNQAKAHMAIPIGWTSGEIDFILYGRDSAGANAKTFTFQTQCYANNSAANPDFPGSYNTTQTLTFTPGGNGTFVQKLANIQTTGVGSCAAGNFMEILITRTDSNTGLDVVYGMYVTFVRAL